MSMLRRSGVAPFLFIEGVLYAVYLWRDLAAWGDGSSVPLKYAAIFLCAVFTLLWASLGGGDRLTALALALTAGADVFLLVLDAHYAVGLLLFCGVQLCYLARLLPVCGQSLWGVRLGLFLLSLPVLYALGFWNVQSILAFFYGANFICNLWLSRPHSDPRLRLFFVGLCLFFCCDLCVAAYQVGTTLPTAVYAAVRVGMWLFYLPGQVLIALSALPARKI